MLHYLKQHKPGYNSNCINVYEWLGMVSAAICPDAFVCSLLWQQRTWNSLIFPWSHGYSVCSLKFWLLHRRHEVFMRVLFPSVVPYLFKCHNFQWFLWDIAQHIHACIHAQRHTYMYPTGMDAHSKPNCQNDQSYHFYLYQVPDIVLSIFHRTSHFV